ncbi:MAG: hypothetical protein PHU53_00540 [Thermoplasmata archaeon]|nr:hypothetical protein [Thermoplasmata archaeon]
MSIIKRNTISPAVVIISVFFSYLLSSIAKADMGNGQDWDTIGMFTGRGDVYFGTFAINILLNAIIFVIPLIIFSKFDYDKEVSPMWIWVIPLISIIGAHIDIWIFEDKIITWSAGLLLIGVSFFFSTTIIMGHKFATGIMMALWAMLMNYLAWMYLNLNDSKLLIAFFWIFGVFYCIFLISLFIYNLIHYIQHDTEIRRNDLARQGFCIMATLVLLLIPLIYFTKLY